MRADRGLLLGIVALLLVLSVTLVLPYVQFVLGAIVLAFVLRPLQSRLVPRIGETPAAIALVVVSLIALLFPFFVVIAFVAGDVVALARSLDEGEWEFETVEESIADYTGLEVDLQEIAHAAAERVSESAFGGAVTAFETLTHLLIGTGLLLFLLFFFVRDGDRFVAWSREMAPLPPTVADDLIERIRAITSAVLVGHVLVAIIQGVIAGIGLAVVGIPNTIFWTFVMVILALIPLIGTFAVWAPASLYLVWMGRPLAGGALFIYGATVVGISDEYLRPVIVDRYAQISPSVIIVGVIGGITVLGFMGIFVGPIVVGALKETIEVYDEHYGRDARRSSG